MTISSPLLAHDMPLKLSFHLKMAREVKAKKSSSNVTAARKSEACQPLVEDLH